MSRIRSIKPEFWSSEQVMECSPLARLLFIGIWNFSDDHGRFPVSPKQLKALVFAADDISSDDVRRMLDELSANGLIRFYDHSGKAYFFVTGWHHQKIDKRGKPKYPAPPKFDEGSTSTPRKVEEPSGTDEDVDEELVLASKDNSDGEVSLSRVGVGAHAREGHGHHADGSGPMSTRTAGLEVAQ